MCTLFYMIKHIPFFLTHNVKPRGYFIGTTKHAVFHAIMSFFTVFRSKMFASVDYNTPLYSNTLSVMVVCLVCSHYDL